MLYGPCTIPSELEGIIVATEGTLSGGLRFEGTRVFVSALLDGIAGGESLEEILESYPSIQKEQALAVLDWQATLAREYLGIRDVG